MLPRRRRHCVDSCLDPFRIGQAALENGKHVFVEKPFTATSAQAEELIELAARKNLKIMVDHTFLFTGAVKKISQLVDENDSRQTLLLRFDSRQSGPLSARCQCHMGSRAARSVDHGPRDQSRPEAVAATGETHLNGHEDIAFITVYFPDKIIAHINVNWLSPVKVRTTLMGGEKKMLVWNDLEADEKIKVYDKGVNMSSEQGVHKLLVSYRSGDMWSPQIEQVEALSRS